LLFVCSCSEVYAVCVFVGLCFGFPYCFFDAECVSFGVSYPDGNPVACSDD
jgi:hypothetical protein